MSAAAKIVEATTSLQGAGLETKRQKRHRLGQDDRVQPTIPTFLQGSGSGAAPEAPGGSQSGPISPMFRPAWGIRRRDSVLGDTRVAQEWSFNSITPRDYQDGVNNRDFETVQRFGSQGLATVFTFPFLLSPLFILSPFSSIRT